MRPGASNRIAVLTTVGIVASLLFESVRFFQIVAPIDFLTGTHWSPQTALREDQAGSAGAFGAVPLFVGTLLIMTIAMVVAAPIGLHQLGADLGRRHEDVGRVGPDPQREHLGVLEEQQVVVPRRAVQAVLEGQGVAVAHPAQPPDVEGRGGGGRHREGH